MYTITRQDAAEKLGVSTRSVDRYIKSGKLRSKKDGKIIYIHEKDIYNMMGSNDDNTPEVIIPEKKSKQSDSSSYTEQKKSYSHNTNSQEVASAQNRATLEKIYIDLRNELQQKDKTIQNLSIRLGQAQEIAKNSVSLVEFKKSQFLLEESKDHLGQENNHLKEKNSELSDKLKYERGTNRILIVLCSILLIGSGLIWFIMI